VKRKKRRVRGEVWEELASTSYAKSIFGLEISPVRACSPFDSTIFLDRLLYEKIDGLQLG